RDIALHASTVTPESCSAATLVLLELHSCEEGAHPGSSEAVVGGGRLLLVQYPKVVTVNLKVALQVYSLMEAVRLPTKGQATCCGSMMDTHQYCVLDSCYLPPI
ncbi:hypothetical protein GBF38_014390, partial [Nibea albiflora]